MPLPPHTLAPIYQEHHWDRAAIEHHPENGGGESPWVIVIPNKTEGGPAAWIAYRTKEQAKVRLSKGFAPKLDQLSL